MGTHRCSICHAVWRGRAPRWCGRCGEPIVSASPSSGRAGRRRALAVAAPLVAGTFAVAAITVVVVVGGRHGTPAASPPSTPVGEATIDAPTERALDRIADREPPADGATCVARPDCFRWRVDHDAESGPWGLDAQVTITDDGGIVLRGSGEIRVHELDDGTLRWAREHSPPSARTIGDVVVAGDLLVAIGGTDGAVAWSTTDGGERWRTDDLAVTGLWDRVVDGDQLVLNGPSTIPVSEVGVDLVAGAPYLEAVVAVDLATGAVRWETTGQRTALGATGAALVGTDGVLRGLDRDGEVRWSEPVDDSADGHVDVTGGHVTVQSADGAGTRIRRLEDGAPLDVDGWIVQSDGDRALGADWSGAAPTYWFVSGDEVRWSSPVDEHDDGQCGAAIGETEVRLHGCGGSEIVLDAATGEVVTSTAPQASALDPTTGWVAGQPLGPYVLWYDDAGVTAPTALRVIDRRDGEDVARFPADTQPVGVTGADGNWTIDLGVVALFVSEAEIVALDLDLLDLGDPARGTPGDAEGATTPVPNP